MTYHLINQNKKLDEGYQRSTINYKICCSLNYNLNNKNFKIISDVNDLQDILRIMIKNCT